MSALRRAGLIALTLWLAGGCALMPNGRKESATRVYVFAPSVAPDVVDQPGACGILEITAGRAAGGHRSSRMAYMRTPYQIEYFAYSIWADTPVRLITARLLEFLEEGQAFEAVIPSPVAVPTSLRLELSDASVLQRFDESGSRIEIALEARLYAGDRRVLLRSQRFAATREASPDPAGGVSAANDALAGLLPQLHDFATRDCADGN